jgi:hypothetical protein
MSQSPTPLHALEQATLAALAGGIIPADDRDAGAAAVQAAEQLGARIARGQNASLYRQGIALADQLAAGSFQRPVSDLAPDDLHELIGRLREQHSAFFRQLRMDVSALYLGDAGVRERIGFPGPAAPAGGYPDFDQPPPGVEPAL